VNCVPDVWRPFRVTYRLLDGGTLHAIRVRSMAGSTAQVVGVRVDGKALAPVDGAAV
jgi:hypothetical protein